MHWSLLWHTVATILALGQAVPTPEPFEHRPRLPAGWVKRGRVEPDALHQVRIALTMGNIDKGDDCLMDVSDPDSSNYGKHWTAQQVADFFRPTNETIAVVRQWIEETLATTLPSFALNRGHLEFTATNSELESLLATEFHYHHDLARRGLGVPSTHAYHVPEHIRRHVDYITPGIILPRSKVGRRGVKTPEPPVHKTQPAVVDDLVDKPCNGTFMSPQCTRRLYGIPEAPPKAVAGYEHAMYTSGLSTYYQGSLDTLFRTYQLPIPNGTHPKSYNIDGGPDPLSPVNKFDAEISENLQIAYPFLYPTEIVLLNEGSEEYQKNNPGYQNLMLDALDASYCDYTAFGETGDLPHLGGEVSPKDCGTINPPKVIVSSWDDVESDVPLSWQRRQCNEYMKLSLQGVTFFYATGDTGVADNTGLCFGPNNDVWTTPWPSNCPYVTGVGGTMIKPDAADPGDPASNPEQSLYHVHGMTSSGGISAVYDRPSWQKDAVGNYLANTKIAAPGFAALAPDLPNPTQLDSYITKIYTTGVSGGGYGQYPTLGRGVPDLSALGDIAWPYADGDDIYQSGGTGASAQVPAAIITRINLERMAIGKGPVGFINPVLYKYADKIVRDITDGHSNGGCKTQQPGYPVARGWDPVTGLGALMYEEALEVFLGLP